MFSTKMQSLKSPLTEEEKKILHTFEYCIAPANFPERLPPSGVQYGDNLKYVEDSLTGWRQESIVRFILNSTESTVLRDFCAANPVLRQKWVQELTEHNKNSQGLGTPNCDIRASDGSETHSVFDHYQSEYFLSLFNLPRNQPSESDAKDRAWLINQAIQLGSYEAMSFRCSLTTENLLKNITQQTGQLSEEKILLERQIEEKNEDSIQNIIFVDINRLCKLYGAIGYLHSAKELYNLSDYFRKQIEKAKKDRGQSIFDEAVKNIICASLLSEDDESNYLLKIITKDEGIAFLGSIPALKRAKTWEEALEILSSWYADKVEFENIQKRAKAEILSRHTPQASLNTAPKVQEAESKKSLTIHLAKLKSPLDENEKRTLREFELAIEPGENSSSAEEKLEKFNTAISNLSKWRQETVIRFSLKSDILKNCFVTNALLQQKWIEHIKERNKNNATSYGIPDKALVARDHSKSHSVFDHYCSDYYLSLLKEAEEKSEKKASQDLLSEIAPLGSFETMALYCIHIAKTCSRANSLSEEKTFLEKGNTLTKAEKSKLLQEIYEKRLNMLATLEKELKHLYLLYGTSGYVFSANLLHSLFPFYQRYPNIHSILFKIAACDILCASYLASDPQSVYTQATILKGNSPFSLFTVPELQAIKSWDQAKDYLKENAPKHKLLYEEDLVRNAQREINVASRLTHKVNYSQ